jgi:hypothetical protein
MTAELKSNLSQILRQQKSKLNVAQSSHINQSEQSPVLKPFSLRTTVNSFVVDKQFALQIDKII